MHQQQPIFLKCIGHVRVLILTRRDVRQTHFEKLRLLDHLLDCTWELSSSSVCILLHHAVDLECVCFGNFLF